MMADQAEITALGESETQLGGCGHVLRLVVTRQTGATSRACPADWSVRVRTAPWGATVRYPRLKAVEGGAAKYRKAGLKLWPDISVVSRGTKRLGWGP